jgi:RNA polymerase sigma-70 factor (ECF subfamily)
MSSKSSAIEANHHITEDLIKEEWQQVEAARKDVNAFRPLYDKYFDRIFRFIYRRTENEEVTADLTSQTFLKALKKLDKYSFKGVPFSAWLYRIADNEVKAFYRLSFKKRVLSLDGEEIKALAVEDSLPETQDFSKPLLKSFEKAERPGSGNYRAAVF